MPGPGGAHTPENASAQMGTPDAVNHLGRPTLGAPSRPLLRPAHQVGVGHVSWGGPDPHAAERALREARHRIEPSGRLGQRGLLAAAWDLKGDGVLQLVELPLQAR